ncbi:uncharacterized protein BDZ99DRAFT_505478 [Mytilinidion resinicola]|uniref:Alpha-L-arabinofuranosidase n=1 Tax=Mytilinidion resinicola TaxID=574789 RepID=A0A6A6Z675_9PEZI|nr:uncharacterized protein BDZ99DRAFT_505478 [Mytilinidion resinicola]KAF2815794.1 hypothetical protein BDZ99DRAFT_505478 [Mytilinidion resinicola]
MRSLILLATAIAAAFAGPLLVPDEPISGSVDALTARQTGSPPSSFRWSSSGVLIGPKSDSRNIAGIKDPSIVYYNGQYHVFASTAQSSGYNLVYLSFTDFSQADSATFNYLDQTPISSGYRAAPQVFCFEPQGLWYNPSGWSSPKHFYSGTPSTVSANIGSGYWVDMWVICDASNCHLFSSDDNGHLYRSQTSLSSFPNGMNEPVVALSDSKNALFEASNVYSVGGATYLLVVEAISSDGKRYFRLWTAGSLAGPWTRLANTEANPFARADNVAFSGTAWTQSIRHGKMVRTDANQTMATSPCNLRYLYQGVSPSASGNYNSLPWRVGLLTRTKSAC